ncbi:MAG: phosphotransferase family protein [Myxococcota bacterium]
MEKLDCDERVRRIEAWIGAQSGRRARVANLRRMAGGSSRQVWSLDVELDGASGAERSALVLRIDPTAGSAAARGLASDGGGFRLEFRLLEEALRCQVPVPRVYWPCAELEPLGGPFYFMDRVEGETIGTRILREASLAHAREQLPAQLGSALARIHRMNPDAPGLERIARPASGVSSALEQLAQVRRGIDGAPSPTPVCEWAYRWLEKNVPRGSTADAARTLVHGDYRMGNVVVGPDGLRAVLDWELAHVGDPHEDLAWMCTKTWRFGNPGAPVGGVGPREPFQRAYERESGRALDTGALRWWETLGSAKVCVVWIVQMNAYLSGVIPSVEQAAIGRRMAETEFDLLELLEGG